MLFLMAAISIYVHYRVLKEGNILLRVRKPHLYCMILIATHRSQFSWLELKQISDNVSKPKTAHHSNPNPIENIELQFDLGKSKSCFWQSYICLKWLNLYWGSYLNQEENLGHFILDYIRNSYMNFPLTTKWQRKVHQFSEWAWALLLSASRTVHKDRIRIMC